MCQKYETAAKCKKTDRKFLPYNLISSLYLKVLNKVYSNLLDA